MAPHNFLATGICQGGGAGAVNLAAGTTSGGNATHPLWAAGLQVPLVVGSRSSAGFEIGYGFRREVATPRTQSGWPACRCAPVALDPKRVTLPLPDSKQTWPKPSKDHVVHCYATNKVLQSVIGHVPDNTAA